MNCACWCLYQLGSLEILGINPDWFKYYRNTKEYWMMTSSLGGLVFLAIKNAQTVLRIYENTNVTSVGWDKAIGTTNIVCDEHLTMLLKASSGLSLKTRYSNGFLEEYRARNSESSRRCGLNNKPYFWKLLSIQEGKNYPQAPPVSQEKQKDWSEMLQIRQGGKKMVLL